MEPFSNVWRRKGYPSEKDERIFSGKIFFNNQEIENVKRGWDIADRKDERWENKKLFKLFVGNLSFDMDHVWLRSLFSGFGRISQLFVSYKANRFGRKFGFVSFYSREEAVEAISYLNNCWVHDGRIRVCFARPNFNSFSNSNTSLNQEAEIILKHDESPLAVYSSSVEDKEWLDRSLVGYIKFPEKVDVSMEKLLLDIPFNVTLTMISAARMLVTFENKEDMNSVMQEGAPWIDEAFENMEIWSPKLVCNEKFLRVRIEGIPLHAWNFKFFSALCSNWGVLVKVDEDNEARNRLDCCHLTLRVCSQSIPSEAWIMIDGVNFKIKIFQENHEYIRPIVHRKSNFPRNASSLVNLPIEKDNFKDCFVPYSQGSPHRKNSLKENTIGNQNYLGSSPISAIGNQISNSLPEIEDGEFNAESDGNQLEQSNQLQEANLVDSSPEIPPGFENSFRNSNFIPPSEPLSADNQNIKGQISFTSSANILPSINEMIPSQPITNSQPLRRSSRKGKSTFRKVLFDLEGLNKENCKENKEPLSADDVLRTGMQLGMVLEIPFSQASHDIQTILDAEASREVISNL